MAIKFRKVINRAVGGNANYLFLGDLTVWVGYPYDKDISAETELQRWDYKAERYYGMCRLTKIHPFTFPNGSGSSIPDSDLDHVYASEHLKFRQFNGDDGSRVEVDVRGWVNNPAPAEKDQWIADYSDHSGFVRP